MAPFVKFIGMANLIYCTLTIGLLIKYYDLLTVVGKIYFLTEVVLIGGLSFIELNGATINKENR
ncbi:hypothetical protein GCM10027085_02580 [Spirosoma aerophilum]